MSTPSTTSSSPLARAALTAYLFLIVYASWYPFSTWRDLGLPPWEYLFAQPPQYWTVFDVVTNIIGYVPLGILQVFTLYPRLRGPIAVILATVVGVALSAGIEAGQTYLPSRVPSNLDLAANFCGVVIGSLIGVFSTRTFLDQGHLHLLRVRWFVHDASRGLVVLALWPLAQIYPQGYLFGLGELTPLLSEWLSWFLEIPIDIASLLRGSARLAPEQYWLSETIITACQLTGALLMMLCMMRKTAPKWPLLLCLMSTVIIVKSLSCALVFNPENAFAWLTPGAQGGLLIGSLMVGGLAYARPIAQLRIAAAAFIVSLIIINIVPANPYFLSTLQNTVQGKFLNFHGAARFLSLLWPFLAVIFLLSRSYGHSERGVSFRL